MSAAPAEDLVVRSGDGESPTPSNAPFHRRIAFRLPASIGALLALVVVAMTTSVHLSVRSDSVDAAEARLRDVAGRLADATSRSTATLLDETAKFCARDELRSAFVSPSAEATAAAAAFLDPLLQRNPRVLAAEFWDAEGARTLSVVNREVEGAEAAGGAAPSWADDERASAGALRSFGEDVVLPVACPVRVGERVAGHVVVIRRASAPAETLALLRNLIGPDATILVRDRSGTWTDFTRIVEGPPPDSGAAAIRYDDPNGRRWLAAGEDISGLGWSLWVRMPFDAVLARADALAARTAWIGAAVVVAGAVGGWVLSRRITKPLAPLRRAAEAMARGDFAQRVTPSGPMELERLAEAFNFMADHVGAVNADLERRIEERTGALRAAIEDLNSFSYSVSHDLRAPLRAINGFSVQLVEDHAGQLDEPATACLARIRAAVARMELLIDDLLELSRVVRQPLDRAECDLSRLAEEVVAELRAAAPDRAAEVRIEPGLRAVGDDRLLRLVLQNLLGNSWKFTSKRARALIEFGAEPGTEPVYFVRDDGAGFDMEYGKKLFGVFERAHSLAEFPGTGVGLAIVHRIVQRHGGRVWGEGAVGAGATFRFTLPGG